MGPTGGGTRTFEKRVVLVAGRHLAVKLVLVYRVHVIKHEALSLLDCCLLGHCGSPFVHVRLNVLAIEAKGGATSHATDSVEGVLASYDSRVLDDLEDPEVDPTVPKA